MAVPELGEDLFHLPAERHFLRGLLLRSIVKGMGMEGRVEDGSHRLVCFVRAEEMMYW